VSTVGRDGLAGDRRDVLADPHLIGADGEGGAGREEREQLLRNRVQGIGAQPSTP
jgi:hypothetical protein